MQMTKVKVQTKQEFRSDAAWLESLWRQAGVSVRSDEALVPLSVNEPVTMSEQALACPKLRARAEQIVHRAQDKWLPIFPLAAAPLFRGWRLYKQDPHYDYVFCNLAEDPLFSDPDGFPIPERVLQHLQRLNQTSLAHEFDLLYVVHEVEKDTICEGEPLTAEKLVPPSPHVMRSSQQLGAVGMGLWLGTAVPLLAGAGLGLATAAAGFVMLAPWGLDPLLLGAVVAPGRPIQEGEMAIWFYLAHWRYADKEA